MTTEREESIISAAEWEAWQDVCRELRALGIEVNEIRADVAIRTIILWGEHLARLRGSQISAVSADAMREITESLTQAIADHAMRGDLIRLDKHCALVKATQHERNTARRELEALTSKERIVFLDALEAATKRPDPSRMDTDGMKCPKCGAVDKFAIEIASTRYFDAEGMYDSAPCEGDFYNDNLCMCQADDCGHEGTVFDFLPKVDAHATA